MPLLNLAFTGGEKYHLVQKNKKLHKNTKRCPPKMPDRFFTHFTDTGGVIWDVERPPIQNITGYSSPHGRNVLLNLNQKYHLADNRRQ